MLDKYKAKQAAKNIPNTMGDIHPTIVPKMATPANKVINVRKKFFERRGLMKSNITITTAGLKKITAGFQATNEPANLIGADIKSITAIKTITKPP